MIIFLTDELPRPDAAGHLAMNHAILAWLREEGHEVRVLLTGTRLARPLERYRYASVAGPHIRQLGAYTAPFSLRAASLILGRKLARHLPAALAGKLRQARNQGDAVLGSFSSQADLRWCAQEIARLRPQAVLIDTIFRAPILTMPELSGVNAILITHDVFHRRAEALAMAGYHVRPDGLTRQLEASLLNRARHIAAIQPEEAQLLQLMCPLADVFTAPMPAIPCPPPPGTEKIPGRLVFIGSDSLPNLDGLRWFFSEIWPLLRGHGLSLDLIGDCGPALRRLPPDVTIHGRVADPAPLLHRAALAISPLRAGSGLKIKLLDYARHGLLTIATPPSLQGFNLDPGSPFIIAGSAGIFADAILKQLAAPAQPEQAFAYISRHYGTQRAFAGLKTALSQRAFEANGFSPAP